MTDTKPSSARPSTATEAAQLLRSTRRLTATAVCLLAVQLSGNLYEQVVSNAAVLADPRPGASVGALEAGSPLFFYLPWAPLGVLAAVLLAVRVHRRGPAWVARRLRWALVALAVAVAAKVVLITQLNDRFRDPAVPVSQLRSYAAQWAMGNGVAVVAVAVAVVLLVTWRARVADTAISGAA